MITIAICDDNEKDIDIIQNYVMEYMSSIQNSVKI